MTRSAIVLGGAFVAFGCTRDNPSFAHDDSTNASTGYTSAGTTAASGSSASSASSTSGPSTSSSTSDPGTTGKTTDPTVGGSSGDESSGGIEVNECAAYPGSLYPALMTPNRVPIPPDSTAQLLGSATVQELSGSTLFLAPCQGAPEPLPGNVILEMGWEPETWTINNLGGCVNVAMLADAAGGQYTGFAVFGDDGNAPVLFMGLDTINIDPLLAQMLPFSVSLGEHRECGVINEGCGDDGTARGEWALIFADSEGVPPGGRVDRSFDTETYRFTNRKAIYGVNDLCGPYYSWTAESLLP